MNESYFKKYADRINKVKAELIQELEKSKGKIRSSDTVHQQLPLH
ncbi:hypothetical protein LEP1GSC116_4152 [Leptospira interrogans serovar Icterohaemorrhagiae str. Verdun HP]|uniref:Uncharacterized protein n=1 Tax=Leptospira interrogans serovar Icterohaemorrhagiae str. Verdun HP TaxID=1049910 RepID=M6REP8_LEPIR|nr:hypothetical protein LEP1GSC116_4152 [Leptospira interrogans serovar Icterohaemorrhagiae str. Verdun HP]